jgi:hypothetical protein
VKDWRRSGGASCLAECVDDGGIAVEQVAGEERLTQMEPDALMARVETMGRTSAKPLPVAGRTAA